jgi:hypothetical protein
MFLPREERLDDDEADKKPLGDEFKHREIPPVKQQNIPNPNLCSEKDDTPTDKSATK